MTTALKGLVASLEEAKERETVATLGRICIEQMILDHPEVASKLKKEGSTSFKDEGLTVTTGFTRTWDALSLIEMSSKIKPEYFPFEVKLAEVRKDSKVIEAEHPELWEALAGCLTIKPKKPALTLKKKVAS